jgi:PAS domain S-box-containing protein
MKDKKFAGLFFLFVVFCFCIFFISFNQYKKNWLIQEMDRHSKVIKENVWATNYTGVTGYLTLVAERENYSHIELIDTFNQNLLTIEGAKLTGLDYILDMVKLLPQTIITSDVKYNQHVIGTLVAHHRNMVFYIHFYVFLLFILIYTVVIQFRKIVQVKIGLEDHVRKRTEELNDANLRFSKNIEILNQAQKIAHIGHFEYDIVGDNLYWSPETYQIMGQDANTFTPSYDEYFALLHIEDRDYAHKEYRRARKKNTSFDFETRILMADGTIKYIQNIGKNEYDQAGKPIRTVGMILDTTDRKKAEEAIKQRDSKYSKMVANIGDVIVIVDQDGINRYKSSNIEKLFGWKPKDVVGASTWENVHPNDLEATQKFVGKLMSEPDSVGTTEYRYRCKDGSYSWIEFTGTNLLHDPDINGLLGNYHDITKRKLLEEQLRQTQKMESIGNLAGGIAHDFNNLLFPILGMSEMLLEDLPKDSLEHENAQEIFNAGKRAGDLVKQILAFSKQSEHKMTPVRIQNILKEVLKLSHSIIPSNIEIQENIDWNCGLIMADATQIHQVAMNLITNAFHAIKDKNGIIDVKLKKIELENGEIPDSLLPPDQYIQLSVADNGAGMAKSIQNKIFDPYFTTKEVGKGTGLGLAVVHGIVKEHNGDIKVYSEEGKGSTFHVYLPLMKINATPVLDSQSLKLPTGTERILLVDDEISVAKLEGQMLSRLGYQVTKQTNSSEAFSEFKTNPENFDLVISDMTMPNMTGDQLAKKILSIKPDMPIIICTGFSERVNKEQAEVIGVKGFLMKPVGKYDMAQMVRKILDEAKNYEVI